MSSVAVLWLPPLPVCPVLLLHTLSRNRSDLCKTSSNALESDLLPALPFHKANFHQHCIWRFFLTFRWCSVNSWLGLLDLPVVADSLNQWARESFPFLSCRADPSSLDSLAQAVCFLYSQKISAKVIFTLASGNGQPESFRLVLGSATPGCPQHSCLSSVFCYLSLCAVPKLIKVVIQVPSPQSTSFRFLPLELLCDLSKDPFTWSRQPLFYLFVKWDAIGRGQSFFWDIYCMGVLP